MDIVTKARNFAREKHAGQVRKGAAQEPYEMHLAEVAALVAGFGGTDLMVAAAWLHDTVEDCDVPGAEIAARFGAQVAAIVAEMTDDKALEAAARKRAQVAHAPKKSPGGALVKICDKISNIRAVADSPALDWTVERQAEYLRWSAEVVASLPDSADVARPNFAADLARGQALVAARQAGLCETSSARRT
jgi:(p)ppGpp synthase/HD superfamily hydrolase